MIQSITTSKEGKPSLMSMACGYLTDKVILNSLRHSINSLQLIDTKARGKVQFFHPITIVVSLGFVAIGLFMAGILTQLMQ